MTEQALGRSLTVTGLNVDLGARQVLHDLELTFAAGQLHFLIGANGSGKTTLLRALGQLLPYRGHIRWGDNDLQRWNARQVARLMAWVPQSYVPHQPLSVYAYVLMGRFPYLNWLGQYQAADHHAAQRAITRMRLAPLQHRPINQLSGGERQKATIARALCQETDIILLDEPAQSLDPLARQQLFDLLFELADEGKTLLCSTHHLQPCNSARVVALAQGKVVLDQHRPQFDAATMEKIYGAHSSPKNS